MGLKHLLLINIVLLLSILTGITLGGESSSGRLRCLLLVEGQWKMLANFVRVVGVTSILGTWQNKQLSDVPFSHNNHKGDLRKECCTH